MFLTRKQVIIRDVKKILCGLVFVVTTSAVVFSMMLMVAKHNEIHQWFYKLLGM